MAKKTFSIISDPGLTIALTIERKSDGYFWNGSDWQAGSTTLPMTEAAGWSLTYSEYSSDTQPNASCFWKALDDSDNFIDRGEFSGVGGTGSSAPSALDYPAFSDAYNQVELNCGNLLGSDEAKRLVNESLRVLAQTEPWDWLVPEAGGSFETVDETAQYALPVGVDQLVSAWSESFRSFYIIDYRAGGYFDLANRREGEPHTLMLLGNNVLVPDPRPNGVYTIYYNYKKLFNLVEDGDKFPCGINFVDAIVSRATWFGAEILEKGNLAQTHRKAWQDQLQSLALSRIHRSHMTFGDSGYGFLRARDRRYR